MMMRHAAASSPCACASADQKIGKPDNQKCAANLREACSHTLLLLCEDTARHSDALHPLEHAGKHGSSAGDRPAAPSPAPRRCCPRTQRAAAWPPCPLPCVWPWLCACPCCVSSFSWHREQLRPPPAHASRAPNEHAARRRRHQISARSPYRTVAQACLHEAKSVCQQDRRCASPGAASRRPLSATPTQHAWRCGRRASGADGREQHLRLRVLRLVHRRQALQRLAPARVVGGLARAAQVVRLLARHWCCWELAEATGKRPRQQSCPVSLGCLRKGLLLLSCCLLARVWGGYAGCTDFISDGARSGAALQHRRRLKLSAAGRLTDRGRKLFQRYLGECRLEVGHPSTGRVPGAIRCRDH